MVSAVDGTKTTIGLVLDCADPVRLGAFWAAALGYRNAGQAGVYVALYPTTAPGPQLLLQQVAEPKVGKNRMHLDIDVTDLDVEVTRLVGLGATQLSDGRRSEHGSTWVTMADPEGNEFCVVEGHAGGGS